MFIIIFLIFYIAFCFSKVYNEKRNIFYYNLWRDSMENEKKGDTLIIKLVLGVIAGIIIGLVSN